METIAEISVDPIRARVYEHGWQSWSPTETYKLGDRPHRPVNDNNRLVCYRPDVRVPADAFQGEGLLAVEAGDGGPVHVLAAVDARVEVPEIRSDLRDRTLVVSASGHVDHVVDEGGGGIDGALARWAEDYAARTGVGEIQPAPTIWCSWYHYYTRVSERDMLENLDAMDKLEVPVDVVQLDDGYQVEIGDWLELSGRFTSLPDLLARIRERGRRAGIWTAPFLVGSKSQLAAQHPDWLVGGVDAPVSGGHNWDQQLFALDVTHPGAAAYLREVFTTFREWGIDFFKIDFIYAGALDGRRREDIPALQAYRAGVELIRDAIGSSYLLGCGAPILPSVGLVDAMRVGPDVGPVWEPVSGDLSQPSIRAAMMTSAARAFQHGRFWVNDPDCLVARPKIERREDWAEHIARYGGLRGSSDRLADLDDWGLEATRRLLSEKPPKVFVTA
jgi:alpha-galactosidase